MAKTTDQTPAPDVDPTTAAAAIADAPPVPDETDDDKRRAEEHERYHAERVAALDAQEADNNRRIHGLTAEPTTDAGE